MRTAHRKSRPNASRVAIVCKSLRSSRSDVSIAELSSGSLPRVFRRHTLAYISLRQKVEMVSDLGIEIRIPLSIAEQAASLHQQAAERRYRNHFWPSKRNTRPITPEICSQSAVSRASCFNPLLVIE